MWGHKNKSQEDQIGTNLVCCGQYILAKKVKRAKHQKHSLQNYAPCTTTEPCHNKHTFQNLY